MPLAEKAPTMASSSYSGGAGPTGLAPPVGLAESSSNEADESWDPQIIAAGGVGRAARGGGGAASAGVSGRSRSNESGGSALSQQRHITSTAGGGDRPSAAQTAAAAAALSAASGGPAAPSADVGVEVSPSNYSMNGSLMRAATGSAEEAAKAEEAMKRNARSPFLSCVGDASAMFREKINCEYFEERQPSPLKQRQVHDNPDDGDLPSLSPSQKQKQQQIGGRVVTVGGQTAVTSARSLNPPSTKGVRGIIEESEEMADQPSPHSARKQQAFFSQLDVNDVISNDDDEERQQSPVAIRSTEDTSMPASGNDSYEARMEEEMPEDEFNESVATPPQSPTQAFNKSGQHVDASIEVEAKEEEGMMSGLIRTMSDICSVEGGNSAKAAKVGGATAAGAGAAAVVAGAAESDSKNAADEEEGALTTKEGGLDLDICTYLQSICGTPTVANDEEAPPPPPLPPVAASHSPGTYDDDSRDVNTSMNGQAAQLNLSLSRSTDQQENTAIEVEYVDPDYYTSDEEDDGADSGHQGDKRPAATKKKRKGLGLSKGLSKVFGKSKKKIGHHDSEEKKDDGDTAKIAVAAAAAAAAAAVGTTAAVGASGSQEQPDDEDDSQGTADHLEDLDQEPEVVRVPNDGLGLPFDENEEAEKAIGSESWTVDEKNAHLQAMADKAKDDYMYGWGSPPPSPKRASLDADMEPDDSSVPEDDYADWRPSEKRRFLQLLSQGLSPRESARTIKNARRGIEPDVSASTSGDAGAASGSFDGSDVEHPEDEEEEQKVAEEKTEGEGEDEGERDQEQEQAEGKKGEAVEETEDDSMMAAAFAARATAAAVGGVAAAMYVTSKDEDTSGTRSGSVREETEPATVLDETGVGYYDGVKRDDPRDFDDNKEAVDKSMASSHASVQEVAPTKSKRGKILPVSLKSKGFASLDSDLAGSDSEERSQQKRSNIKALSSKFLPSKHRKDGFSTLGSDSETEYEEDFSGEQIAASTARSMASPRTPRESTSSSSSISSAIKMLRPKPGFQKMSSVGEALQESEAETSPQDEDTIFDFNEDDTVAAAGGAAPKAQPDAIVEENDEAPPSSEMSVVSGLTHTTSYTDAMSVATGTTSASGKSTRRRHRGAAKKRLSQAKEAEESASGKSVGWLDSIRAAAATNNRVWDPQLGWVDYSEPEKSDMLDHSGSVVRIGPLSLSGKVAKSRDSGDRGEDVSQAQSTAPSVVPFPEDWKEERSQMIEESFEGSRAGLDSIQEVDADAAAPRGVALDQDGEEVKDSLPFVGGAAATASAVASTVPLMVSPDDNDNKNSDDVTVASGLTAQTGTSTVDGPSKRKGAPGTTKPKGWVESMKIAAANVSANDPNRRWDPQHGWVGLPPGAVPPTESSRTEDDTATFEQGTISSQLDVSKASKGSGPVDLDDENSSKEEEEEDNDEQEEDDVEVERVAINTSMIIERSARPVDLDDSDFEDDSSQEEGGEASIKSENGAQDAPASADIPTAQSKPKESLSNFIESSSPPVGAATTMAADIASDDAVGSLPKIQAQTESSSSSATAGRSFRLPVPKIGRTREVAQGYDELASVTSEKRQIDTEELTTTGEADRGNVVLETHKVAHYEQFKWEESKVTASTGAALPPEIPKKEPQDNAEKSAPEVQVIKLKMSEKDKDLFLSKDDSDHFIDDTNFAPEFADESPFGTPSRPDPSGIKLNGSDIKLDVTASDIVRPQEEDEGKGGSFPSPQARGTAQFPQTTSAKPVEHKAEEASVATRSTLEGEGIDGISVPSVSSRAKQWMELMESKSKKRVVSSNRVVTVDSGKGAVSQSAPKPTGSAPVPAETRGTSDTASRSALMSSERAETHAERSAQSPDFDGIEWPSTGASARRSQSQGSEEWKSFLGKKGQVPGKQKQRQQYQATSSGNSGFVFSAADGTSKAEINEVDAVPRKARSVASHATDATEEDSLFKFNESNFRAAETNQLKSKLEDMSPARQQQRSANAVPQGSGSFGDMDDSGQDDGGDGSEKKSFFKRLSECAAPVIPAGCANPTQIDETGQEVPVSHLQFLKNSKVAGSTKHMLKEMSPSSLCGRTDTIFEERGKKGAAASGSSRTRVVPAQEATKPVQSPVKGSSASSIASGDGFGAKSAYLEALALKAATITPKKKSGGRSFSSEAGSATSQRSNESSEAWQGFLERRSASKSPCSGSAPPPSAEEKAAQKVEEMMKAMAMSTKSKEDIDEMIDTMSSVSGSRPSRDPIERTKSESSATSKQKKKKSESAKAAEELAAARVEAMMREMSSQNLDAGEV